MRSDWSYSNGEEKNWGEHLKKPLNEIIKIIDTESEDGWFYDIQTESETFATGPNLFKIHNSPRRGDKFVTGSFCKQIVQIEKGIKEPILYVGNIESIRDWTTCSDVVRGIWLALEKCQPGTTYNICSNKGYTIKQFIERLFELSTCKNIEIKKDIIMLK